jgi:hypothetical protein
MPTYTPSAVSKAADSAPSAGRDYEAEKRALLARAEEAREQAAAIDLAASAEATLLRTAGMAEDAMGRGGAAAEGARAKIHEQQERFKAHVVADGLSLDDELPPGISVGGARAAAAPVVGNKYAHMMDRRKHLQEQGAN